jgi:septum formation protein
MNGKIILASVSPRRKELLKIAGIAFEAVASNVVEREEEGESAEVFAARMAREKAYDVLSWLPIAERQLVLGADTVVLVDERILGKPTSPDHAAEMLRALSGREHEVITGVCLLSREASATSQPIPVTEDNRTATTKVRFLPLSEEDIRSYVSSGEPFDKAGGYAIQGRASKFVESIEGCYLNVVGLPVSLVWQMLNLSFKSNER